MSPVEEMGEDLFSFLCQERKFGNMQRLAMQLGKKYGDLEPKYMFWVAASCLLQAEFDDNVQSLGLGTMFFQKQIDAQLVQSDEQVRLFVMMLHRLDRFDDIITILCGSLGKLYRFRADRLRDLADAFKVVFRDTTLHISVPSTSSSSSTTTSSFFCQNVYWKES